MTPLRQRVLRSAGRATRQFGVELVPADELQALRARGGNIGVAPHPGMLPAGAREALRRDNPRLLELRRRYGAHPAAASSVWSEEFIERELPLLYFRADSAFAWQTRDAYVWEGATGQSLSMQEVNYLVTALYARGVDELGLLDRLGEDDLLGNTTVALDDSLIVSRDLLDSVMEINFLERELGIASRAQLKVLDIGAGYGRLAHRLAAGLPNLDRAICTDGVAESTFICEYYLGMRGFTERCSVVPLDEIAGTLAPDEVYLATNIHSFSECPLDAIRWWLDLLAANRVRFLFIVPNTGEELTSVEADGSRASFAGELNERGYRLHTREAKYARAPGVQRHGIYPTHYHLYELN